MSIPTLVFSPGWNAQESYSDSGTNSVTLGDGYSCDGASSIHPSAVEWTVSRVGLSKDEIDDLLQQLDIWGGTVAFYWQPEPTVNRKLYFCESWSTTPLGPQTFEFSCKFIEDVRGECLSFAALVDTTAIAAKLVGASSFISAYTGSAGNYLINSTNDLVLRSLHTHAEQIPSDSGTLYDQLTLSLGCIAAYEATEDAIWLTRAVDYGTAIVDSYYNDSDLPHWLRDIKTNARLEDIYYTNRTLATGEVNSPLGWLPLLWELYSKLDEYDSGDPQWATLKASTKTDAIVAATFSNQTFVYRKNTGATTEYPGTQFLGSASRETVSPFAQYVDVIGSSTLIVENIEIQGAVETATTYTAEVGSSEDNQIVEFFVSTATDDTSETAIYRQFWRLGTADTTNTRVFASHELFKWESLAWYYGTGLESGTENYEQNSITYGGNTFPNVVLRLETNAELTLNSSSRNPFKIYCKVTTNPGTLRLKDQAGYLWDYTLPVADWVLREPTWDDFTWSSANVSAQGSLIPSTNGDIQTLEILTAGNVYVWWIGTAAPVALNLPAAIYRAGIRDRGEGSRHLYVGDVFPSNSSTDALPYTLGVVPFARNTVSGTPGTLTGLPYAAYQNAYGWQVWNEPEKLANVISFLKASQASYGTTIGDTGPFAPVYTWNDVDDRGFGGTLNTFGFTGFDAFATSGQYQAQVGLWLARAWYVDQSNVDLRDLAMSWLKWLDQVYTTRNATLPPKTFASDAVAVGGHDPGVQAMIGEAALWCNLAGGDPATTFRWIYRSITYLDSQYVAAGDPMAGSWSASQPVFASTLNAYYSSWHGSSIRYHANLLIHKESITYPPCSEPITIGTSDPLPEICCGATIVPAPDPGGGSG